MDQRKQNITPQTPIRLHDAVCSAFIKIYGHIVELHGANYAVNTALAQHLRDRGLQVPIIETPAEKISAGQRKRWGVIKGIDAEAEAKAEVRREMKRERDRRYRENKKALRDLTKRSDPEE